TGLLMGKPVFDTEDEDSKKIQGKVERGFIKAASMGIAFNREDLQMIDGVLTLIACELYEVSIVAIPSNANAVRLYAENGELMKEEEIKTLCLSITPTEEKINLNQMKKIILSMATLMALGFKDNPTDGHDSSDVEAKVLGLSQSVVALTAENETLKLAAKTAKDAQEAAAKTRITTKVELGITQGKFGADKKEEMITLGLASETALDTVIGSIPAKANFSAGVVVPNGNGAIQVATMEEFQKLSIEAQLSFKNDSPEEYKKLFS
ncbi:HK97 family phage prohead protease, partial [Flavobacterium psychrophilum]